MFKLDFFVCPLARPTFSILPRVRRDSAVAARCYALHLWGRTAYIEYQRTLDALLPSFGSQSMREKLESFWAVESLLQGEVADFLEYNVSPRWRTLKVRLRGSRLILCLPRP